MKNQTSQLISNCLTATALLIAILAPQSSSATIPVLTDQGGNWTATTQEKFYTPDHAIEMDQCTKTSKRLTFFG